MTSSSHIALDKLTEYALAILPPSELHSMHAHFLLCATCREQLRQINLALAAYGTATPQATISSDERDHFTQKLAVTTQVRLAPNTHHFRTFFLEKVNAYQNWFKTGQWVSVLAGILALCLFWLVIANYRLSTDLSVKYAQARQGELDSAQLNALMDLLTSPHMKRVELREEPILANQPEGHIIYSSQNGNLLFTASSLRTLPVEKTYELWVLQVGNHAPLAAGTFTPDNSGNASLIPSSLPAHMNIRGFAISIEDASGSKTPTLPYQLTGE